MNENTRKINMKRLYYYLGDPNHHFYYLELWIARSLPCIGSTVGGIPELLPSEDLVPPGDVTALASKIREVVTNPERMARMSARNLQKAKDYTDEVLSQQRNEFYRYVREMSEAWLKEKQKT
jgi:glycosyltransferase involved in cell wall biosynthesis